MKDKLKNNKTKITKNMKQIKVNNFKFYGYNLPTIMNINLWGRLIKQINNLFIISKSNSSLIYKVTKFNNYNLIELLHNNKIILKFKDMLKDLNNLSTFTRIVNNQEYYFKNGLLMIKILIKKMKILTSIKPNKNINEKFITLDIETRIIDNIKTPYYICIFDGIKAYSFYLTDFNNPEDIIENAIFSLMKSKYNGYKVYIHNLSNFDGVFLLNILASFCPDSNFNLDPIINNGNFINLKLNFDKYNFYFRDSYLLLPLSLRDLAKAFNVEAKGHFPFKFVNENTLDYVGLTPDISFYEDISNIECNKLVSENWSLKNECIKYCIQDCISLHQVIQKFNNFIFDLNQLNINNFPTLPSLAFGIYRSKYLKDFNIPIISGQFLSDIKVGYTGGSTDLYIPYWLFFVSL
jgi:hypothetical protein